VCTWPQPSWRPRAPWGYMCRAAISRSILSTAIGSQKSREMQGQSAAYSSSSGAFTAMVATS
jgi:hypothetical protein